MSLYIIAKIIHVISIIFFIGVVSFRTFIMPVLKGKYNKTTYMDIDKTTGLKARGIIKINNIFLIISGLYLLTFHLEVVNILLYIKVVIGITLALIFYIVPVVMQKFKHIKWFSQFFHYLFFSLMMLVVVLSQMMFQ